MPLSRPRPSSAAARSSFAQRAYGSYEHGYGWGVHEKAPAKVLDAAIFFGEKECEAVLRAAGATSLAEAAAAAAMEALLLEEDADKTSSAEGKKKKKVRAVGARKWPTPLLPRL